MKRCLLYWLFLPFYLNRWLYHVLDWLEREHDLILVWPEKVHWYSWPTIEHASDSTYDETP